MTDGQPDIADLMPSSAEIHAATQAGYRPPKSATPPPPVEDAFEEMAEQSGPVNFFRDLEWAYGNLANTRAKVKDAPSGSAWHMLEYGRSARSDFMKLAVGYFTKKEKETEDNQALVDSHKQQMQFIESLQSEVGKVSMDMMRQATDDQLLIITKERGWTCSKPLT